MMPDKLYFDKIFVAEIKFDNADFPSYNGKFTSVLTSADNLSQHILNYVDYSIRQDRHDASLAGLTDYEPQKNEEKELALEGNKYIDLVETGAWKILESDGTITKILAPIFGFENTIVWRPAID